MLLNLLLILIVILLFKGGRSGAKIIIAAPVVSFLRVLLLVEAVREYAFLRAVFFDCVWGFLTLHAYLNFFTPLVGIFGALFAGRRLYEVVEAFFLYNLVIGRGVNLRTAHIVWGDIGA